MIASYNANGSTLAANLQSVKASNLNLYFSNSISVEYFFESIKTETEDYMILMAKTGSSIPLNFNEDQAVLIDSDNLRKLIIDITNNNFDLRVLGYICDCLTLGVYVEFLNPMVKEITFDLADPEINSLSKETVLKILKLLETV